MHGWWLGLEWDGGGGRVAMLEGMRYGGALSGHRRLVLILSAAWSMPSMPNCAAQPHPCASPPVRSQRSCAPGQHLLRLEHRQHRCTPPTRLAAPHGSPHLPSSASPSCRTPTIRTGMTRLRTRCLSAPPSGGWILCWMRRLATWGRGPGWRVTRRPLPTSWRCRPAPPPCWRLRCSCPGRRRWRRACSCWGASWTGPWRA